MTDRINYHASKPSFDLGRVLSRSFAGVFKNIKHLLLAIVIVIVISAIASTPMFFLDDATPQGPAYWIGTILSSAA